MTKTHIKILLAVFGVIIFSSWGLSSFFPCSAYENVSDNSDNFENVENSFEIYDQYIIFRFDMVEDPEYVIFIEMIDPASIDAFGISVTYFLLNGSEFTQSLGQWGSLNGIAEYHGQTEFVFNTEDLSFLGEVGSYEFFSNVDLIDGERLEIPIGGIYDFYISFEIYEVEENSKNGGASGGSNYWYYPGTVVTPRIIGKYNPIIEQKNEIILASILKMKGLTFTDHYGNSRLIETLSYREKMIELNWIMAELNVQSGTNQEYSDILQLIRNAYIYRSTDLVNQPTENINWAIFIQSQFGIFQNQIQATTVTVIKADGTTYDYTTDMEDSYWHAIYQAESHSLTFQVHINFINAMRTGEWGFYHLPAYPDIQLNHHEILFDILRNRGLV
ncbi:MAG: hypothetical protein ACTSRK_14575 [Promethearchaeota archaeon]